MNSVIFLVVFPAVLLAVNFADSFDSFTPGDELSSSQYWLKTDPSGSLVATDLEGEMVMESQWNGNDFLGYACAGALICTDSQTSAKMMLNGTESLAGVVSRLDPISGEGYIAGLYRVYGTIGATMILYINSSGTHTILSNDYFYPLYENTWYEVVFSVTGLEPVSLELSVDGELNSQFTDNQYNISSGMSGIGGTYQADPTVIRVDDFQVVDLEYSLSQTSFGALKATFR